MQNFIPHITQEREEMLQKIGITATGELFDVIPQSLRNVPKPHVLPLQGKTELDLYQTLQFYASKNEGASYPSFLGGGAYARFIPPAVNTIASRSEFYTAYTPYQPEISQGTLQMIYEFQTMMSELTGMDITNASVYDGATAVSEAALMALRATRRKVLYISQTMNPQYQQVLQTYMEALGGITVNCFDPNQPLTNQIKEDSKSIAGILIQQPDYFGTIHLLKDYQTFCQGSGALFVVNVDPVTLSVLESPRHFGADIVCGDIQQFGNSINFGGPYGGFVSTTEKLLRQLPGRIVGRTTDKEGKTAYTLTLQTREQHIRREKATSNICTNQSLNVLKATAYLSLVGPQGLQQIAAVSTERAHTLAKSLLTFPGVSLRFEAPFLYEFALRLPMKAELLVKQMAERSGILAGINVGKYWPEEDQTLLIAVTELNSKESLHRYIDAFKAVLQTHGLSVVPSSDPNPSPRVLATGTLGRES